MPILEGSFYLNSDVVTLARQLIGKALFSKNQLWIEDRPLPNNPILASPRIGVGYAKEDAKLPWRFVLKNSILSS